MDLATWSWIFMVVYIGGMLAIGVIGQRRVKHADDFATARGSYGPIFLAFAFAATTASGATFLGGPGLGYQWGFASQWGNFLYPIGVYFGVLISMRLIATTGNRFGNRSIPEYLGDRYQSEGIRIMVSIFSLVLFFYLAGQLVSGLVMFEIFLGLPPFWALLITTTVLLFLRRSRWRTRRHTYRWGPRRHDAHPGHCRDRLGAHRFRHRRRFIGFD